MSAAMKKARLPETIHSTQQRLNLTSGRRSRTLKAGQTLLEGRHVFQGRGTDINLWGVARLERHLIVNQATRGFDSLRPSQILFFVV
jgi:hypothetical protein